MVYVYGDFIVRESCPEDREELARTMRDPDVAEIWASSHLSPDEALRISVDRSVLAFTVCYKGQIIAMLGIAPQSLLADRAIIWLLGTEGIRKAGCRFARLCRPYIQLFLEYYPVLENWVDSRYTVAVRWLKWCGADMEPAKPFGPDGVPFHHFEFRRRG